MTKGDETRKAILDEALAQASVVGLDGLTIGTLAKRSGMSKSGLFAHFVNKEGLQMQVLDEARARFVERVVSPSLREPRGEPRVRALFTRWMDWGHADFLPGGCPFIAAAAELDDQDGPVRDRLVSMQRDWVDTLEHAARAAVDEGHFERAVEPPTFAFELWGIALSYHWYARLLGDPDARARADEAFGRLLDRSRA